MIRRSQKTETKMHTLLMENRLLSVSEIINELNKPKILSIILLTLKQAVSKGGFPTNSVKNKHPSAQMSDSGPWPSRCKTSGAIKLGVPQIVLKETRKT